MEHCRQNDHEVSPLGMGLWEKLFSIVPLRPRRRGKNHVEYFQGLSRALDDAGISKPTLVVDGNRLDKNIELLKGSVGTRFDYRIVAKSLPSIGMLQYVMERMSTKRLMIFHQPFLSEVAKALPDADVLMGKPMPVAAARNFYEGHAADSGFNSNEQLQWLIDTVDRLRQYQALAHEAKVSMKINIELDIGLHRGGVSDDQELIEMLDLIESDPHLSLSGFMGYEVHIAKVPGNKLVARNKAMSIYEHMVALAERHLGRGLRHLTLNGAGSPTYKYYESGSFPINEVAAGSCLVKPSDFDLATLVDHVPAAFIATPVLKALTKTELPGVEWLGKVMSLWNPNREKAFFVYGGYWKAHPISPEGLIINPLFGRSTNQEMYNGSSDIDLKADDWIFFRPTQSESVFLQFEDIAFCKGGRIEQWWPVLS